MTQEGTAVFCPHCEAHLTDSPPGFAGVSAQAGRMTCYECHRPFRWEAKVSIVFVTTTPEAPAARRAAS